MGDVYCAAWECVRDFTRVDIYAAWKRLGEMSLPVKSTNSRCSLALEVMERYVRKAASGDLAMIESALMPVA